MKFQIINKTLAISALFACLGAGCEYTKIYEVQPAVSKPSDSVSQDTQDTTEGALPTAPSAEGDEIIVPEPKEDEVAVSPEVPKAEPEGEDAGAVPVAPEAPRADEPPVGDDAPVGPGLGDLPVVGDDAAAPGAGSTGIVAFRGGTIIGPLPVDDTPADPFVTDIEMTFRTGEIRGSGTDAKVFAKFCPTARFDSAECNTFRIDPTLGDDFEEGKLDVATLSPLANGHRPMTQTGGSGWVNMRLSHASYLKISMEDGNEGPAWLLAGLQVRVKVEGATAWKITYLNPCVHRWINPNKAWNEARFGPNDEAIAVVLSTADVENAGTDNAVFAEFPKMPGLDATFMDQIEIVSPDGPTFEATDNDTVRLNMAWGQDYDDFERNRTTAYCGYFFGNAAVFPRFRIAKEADNRSGGWNLEAYKAFVFSPGQERFLSQNQCHFAQGTPGWISDEEGLSHPDFGYQFATLETGDVCEELKVLEGPDSLGVRLGPTTQTGSGGIGGQGSWNPLDWF